MKRLSVTIACDGAPGNFQQASTIRSILENFGVQVYFYQLLQQQNLLDFLAGNYPDSDYTIWFFYGCPDSNGNEQLNFEVVHQQNNDYSSKSGWERIKFKLTPATIAKYIKNPQGTLICGSTSTKDWVKAFLKVGYKAYIAPTQPDLAINSYILFITGFFYYLLMHFLDYSEQQFSPQESVIKAAAMDRDYQFGTKLFHYYEGSSSNEQN